MKLSSFCFSTIKLICESAQLVSGSFKDAMIDRLVCLGFICSDPS